MLVAYSGIGKSFGEVVQLVETDVNDEVAISVDCTELVVYQHGSATFHEAVDSLIFVAKDCKGIPLAVHEAPLPINKDWHDPF